MIAPLSPPDITGQLEMKATRVAAALALVLGFATGTVPARAEDLMQVYREAQQSDPSLASARAAWQATQEKVPQAVAGLLPTVTATANANLNQSQRNAVLPAVAIVRQIIGC